VLVVDQENVLFLSNLLKLCKQKSTCVLFELQINILNRLLCKYASLKLAFQTNYYDQKFLLLFYYKDIKSEAS